MTGPRVSGVVSLEGGSNPWGQITANRYLPGQKIMPHVDNVKHFGECVSLGAAVVVTFATPSGRVVFGQKVEEGPLYVIIGDARYTYTRRYAAGRDATLYHLPHPRSRH